MWQDLVLDLDWMDGGTKETAVRKSKEMLNHIGYPDFIKNVTALDEYYKEVHPPTLPSCPGPGESCGVLCQLNITSTQTYFELVRTVLVWTQAKELRRIKEPFKKDEFEVTTLPILILSNAL